MAKLFSDIYFSGKTLFFFLLVFFSANIFCQETKTIQSVSGAVIDKATRSPLAGANVVILRTSPQKGTTTDENGFFKIENLPVGKIRVKISFVGYTTAILNNIVLSSEKEAVLNVELEKNPFELNEVTVVGRAMRFKQMSLYDGELKEEKNINGFYALEIFKDGNSDEVWGLEKTSTNNFKLSDKIFHGGKTSLDLEWNKLGANEKWVGMGIGWDQWSGKNVELVEDKAAIQFYVRADSGKMKNLVIVFLLEDYNGNQCAAVLKDFNYLENKTIDENWNKVTIPFSEFKTNRDKCDFSNIKQLILQFEVKGHVFIDDMEIVEYGGKKL